MSHTKEPWIVSSVGINGEVTGDSYIYDANADIVTVVESMPCQEDDAEAKANASRIVACVNACAGIETDVLEVFGAATETERSFIRSARRLKEKADRQRDELLAALEKIASPTQTAGLLWWQIEARKAIAKVGAGRTATEGHNAKVQAAGEGFISPVAPGTEG